MARTTHHERKGIAAAELALLLPFLALMFCVAVDFCRAFRAAVVLDDCARSGALYASGAAAHNTDTTTATDAATQAAVAEGVALTPPLKAENVAVAIGTNSATVTVTYPFPLVTSYLGFSRNLSIARAVTLPLAPKAPGAP